MVDVAGISRDNELLLLPLIVRCVIIIIAIYNAWLLDVSIFVLLLLRTIV